VATYSHAIAVPHDEDGDGIRNSVDGIDDADGDGKPNYQDTDSDNDNIGDAGEWSGAPDDPLAGCTANDPVCTDNDADNDQKLNYLDTDSDNDEALDIQEGIHDSDGDGIPDFLDPDTVTRSRFFLPVILR
jgi:hypothetical protein